jgi:hypothetical protein
MIHSGLQRGFAVIRDAFLPGAVSYYVVFLWDEVRFLRVYGNRVNELGPLTNESSSVRSALDQIARHPSFYGQPISIIVDNASSYVVSTRLNDATLKRDSDELRSLIPDRVESTLAVVSVNGAKVLLCAGLDKTSSAHVREQAEKLGINVRSFAPLGLYLLGGVISAGKLSPTLHMISWGDGAFSYGGVDQRGNLFVGYRQCSVEPSITTETSAEITDSLFGTNSGVVAVFYGSTSSRSKNLHRIKSLASLLSTSIPKSLRPATTRSAPQPRVAALMLTAQNSAKLLIHLLTAVCLLALIGVGVSNLLIGGTDKDLDQYQTLYSQRASLETKRDSLSSMLERRQQTAKVQHDPAALFSIFCQSATSSLSLSSITIKNVPGDSTLLEAVGNTRSSGTIFDFTKKMNALITPQQLSVSSFQPEVVVMNNRPDTTLRFRLGMSIHHGR